jgi:hypothetical protein
MHDIFLTEVVRNLVRSLRDLGGHSITRRCQNVTLDRWSIRGEMAFGLLTKSPVAFRALKCYKSSHVTASHIMKQASLTNRMAQMPDRRLIAPTQV